MEQIRTFIAIELDEPTKMQLMDLQKRLKVEMPERAIRWVRAEGIHLTLKFLGDGPATRIERIAEELKEACQGFAPFGLKCVGLGCFPNARRPRVVWVGIEEETGNLARLQRAIEKRLAPLGYPPEKRPFNPHLTLGRVRSRVRSGELRRVGELIEAADIGLLSEMEARAVGLIRSDLGPSGAVYTPLAEAPLTTET
jgi:2'-5' RNA ligase